MPTIAIIGGGDGGNLLAARLLEQSTDGQRLHVMLIEARGRAGDQLKAVVRHAERMAPGAFLTRVRGEATWFAPNPRGGIRLALASGRVLDVDRAAVVTGSVAARAIERSALPAGAELLPSEVQRDQLDGPVDRAAATLLNGIGSPAAPPRTPNVPKSLGEPALRDVRAS